MKRLLAFLLLAAPIVIEDAVAQDDLEDLDSGPSKAKKAKKKKKHHEGTQAQLESEVVREVERGFYMKAGVGSAFYLIKYGQGILRSGTTLPICVGQDFVDKEKSSMAWEVTFSQGVHNGMPFDQQASLNLPAAGRMIQGDTRTFTFMATYEYSGYLSRRVGLGIRLGGGLMLSPLLMDHERYLLDVVQDEWRLNQEPSVHRTPHPLGVAGPTFEYYTKLSHFSIGADADVSYAVGFDLGVAVNGYFKYTF